MKHIIPMLITAALLAVLLWFLVPALCAWLKKPSLHALSGCALTLSNIGEGEHIEFISRYPDNAIGTRFLIAKNGSDAAHADLCGISDIPIGVWYDETGTTTDLTQKRAIALLGARQTTERVAINSNVTQGDYLVADAGSYARTLPTTPGTYYIIGKALQAGVAGDVIEFDPVPQKLVGVTTTLTIPVDLASITAADVLSAMTPGVPFVLNSVTFAVTKPATTAAKLATLSPKITGVAVTGGAVALTSANCTPNGHLVAGSAITALNVGGAADTLTITGSAVTSFIEGQGVLLINMTTLNG